MSSNEQGRQGSFRRREEDRRVAYRSVLPMKTYEELKTAAMWITDYYSCGPQDIDYDCFGEWRPRSCLFRAAKEHNNSPALMTIGDLRGHDYAWGKLCDRTDVAGDRPWARGRFK